MYWNWRIALRKRKNRNFWILRVPECLCDNFTPSEITITHVKLPLQWAPEPFSDASVWVSSCGFGCFMLLPLQSHKFSIHQSNPGFTKGTILTCDRQEFSLLILSTWSSWGYLYCNLARRPACTVDDKRPISFVRSKMEIWGLINNSWHILVTFVYFFSVKDKSYLWSVYNPT